MIYELTEPSKASPLFACWDDLDTSIVACLEKVMENYSQSPGVCPEHNLKED